MASAQDQTRLKPPASFGVGIAGYVLLSAVIPIGIGTAASLWSALELDAFVYGLFAGIAVAMILILPVAVGARQRSTWWIKWFSIVGKILLATYFAATAVVLAYPLGLVHLRPGNDPGTQALAWFAVVLMGIVGLPAAAMLGLALRNPYWRAK